MQDKKNVRKGLFLKFTTWKTDMHGIRSAGRVDENTTW